MSMYHVQSLDMQFPNPVCKHSSNVILWPRTVLFAQVLQIIFNFLLIS